MRYRYKCIVDAVWHLNPRAAMELYHNLFVFVMHRRMVSGIGIKADVAGVGILAFDISVRYRNIPVPDWVPLFWYRPDSGIGIRHSSGWTV